MANAAGRGTGRTWHHLVAPDHRRQRAAVPRTLLPFRAAQRVHPGSTGTHDRLRPQRDRGHGHPADQLRGPTWPARQLFDRLEVIVDAQRRPTTPGSRRRRAATSPRASERACGRRSADQVGRRRRTWRAWRRVVSGHISGSHRTGPATTPPQRMPSKQRCRHPNRPLMTQKAIRQPPTTCCTCCTAAARTRYSTPRCINGMTWPPCWRGFLMRHVPRVTAVSATSLTRPIARGRRWRTRWPGCAPVAGTDTASTANPARAGTTPKTDTCDGEHHW